jgi:hypothetical protein
MNSETNRLERYLKLETSEIVLLVVVIAVATYMLIEAFSFPTAVGRFPIMAASGTLVGAVLLLFRAFLPSGLQKVVSDSTQVFGDDQEFQQLEENEKEEEDEVDMVKVYKTTAFIVGYGVASFLISILYATPLFVALYTIWTGQKWYVTVFLAALMFGVGHLFMNFLIVPLDEGLLVGGL